MRSRNYRLRWPRPSHDGTKRDAAIAAMGGSNCRRPSLPARLAVCAGRAPDGVRRRQPDGAVDDRRRSPGSGRRRARRTLRWPGRPPSRQHAGGDRALARADASRPVFIANVLKCRPPGNRNPQPRRWRRARPSCCGRSSCAAAAGAGDGRFAPGGAAHRRADLALRGRPHRLHVAGRDVPVIVTYHPAYLLRNLADKAKAWADLCLGAGGGRRRAAVGAIRLSQCLASPISDTESNCRWL